MILKKYESIKKFVVLEHLMLPNRGLRFYTMNCHYPGNSDHENNTHGFNGELWYKEVGFADTHDEAKAIIQQWDPSLLPSFDELCEYHKNKDIPNEIKVGDIVTPIQYPELKGVVEKITTYMDDTVYVLKNGGLWTKNELISKE